MTVLLCKNAAHKIPVRLNVNGLRLRSQAHREQLAVHVQAHVNPTDGDRPFSDDSTQERSLRAFM